MTKLEDLFSNDLLFTVTSKSDLKKRNMEEEIKMFARKEDHAKADMTAVVVMSHGREGEIIATDENMLKIRWILEQFNNSNCPRLRGKPKLFIFQSCRGEGEDPGATVTDSQLTVPSWGDMLIAYSTIPGNYSYRNEAKGSWFVQSLSTVFKEHAETYEIREMLDDVSSRLSKYQTERGMKQSFNYEIWPPFKKFYFFPETGNAGSIRGKILVFTARSLRPWK